jgi:hypothetical protein
MREISLTGDVDVLANIEDLSREILDPESSQRKKKMQKTAREINLEHFEDLPADPHEFQLS